MYRRTFTRTAVGAATATILGGTASARSQGSTSGRLVVIYDDAPVEDYEEAFPVHQDLGVPGCVAPPSTWVGNREGTCTVDQLQEMADAGFEVLSHTRQQESLTASPIVRDVEPSDTKIYPENNFHAYHPRYPLQLTNGDKSVTRKIETWNRDEHGAFIEFTEEVGESFDADDTVERYPPKTLEYILANSQASLRHMGFGADNLVAPYDRFSPYVKEIAKEYYDAVPNARPDGKLNDPSDLDPFELHRWYFIENADRAERFHTLDAVAREDKLAILGAHTAKENVTPEKIQDVLQGAKERGIEVVTLREALDIYDVTGSSGSGTSTASTGDETPTGTPAATVSPGDDATNTPSSGERDGASPAPTSTSELGVAGLGVGALAALGGWKLWQDDD